MGDRISGRGVGFIFRLLQFLAWLILATWLGRKLLAWLFGPQAQERVRNMRQPTPRGSRQLHRDPVCGTHVPEGIAVTLESGGQVHYFCSTECREKFRVGHPRQDSDRRAAGA